MESRCEAQKIKKPEAKLAWARGGCLGAKAERNPRRTRRLSGKAKSTAEARRGVADTECG